jgi:acetyl-CoA/propionyl-CoA carboxylase carboxyl transferase subunit
MTDRKDPQLRIERLVEEGSFEYLVPRTDCGMIAATGLIKGNKAVVFASDATSKSGALGIEGSLVILAAYREAMAFQLPIIGIWHSGGARLSDGVLSLDAFGQVFQAMVSASGRIPQLSLVLGPTAGGGAYGPALTDVVVLAPEGRIFVTGPDVVKSVTGEDIDIAALGGPEAHSKNSGVAHVIAPDEETAFNEIKDLVSLFADQGHFKTDVIEVDLARFVPTISKRTYDVVPLIDAILDRDGDKLELLPMWAENMSTVLGRLGGRTVGVIANNPSHIGGVLDAAAAEKAARFVRTCDAFGIPMVVIADVTGFLPGPGQEWEGAVRRGAKLLHAFAESVVPRVTLITRRAFGGAYVAMNSKALGATRIFAWPEAEVSVMGSIAAVRVLHRRILAELPEDQRAGMELELAAEHDRISGGIARAVEIGAVDEVITPQQTRTALVQALATAPHRRGTHTNIPL